MAVDWRYAKVCRLGDYLVEEVVVVVVVVMMV